MAKRPPDSLAKARRQYTGWFGAMLALFALFLVFCIFVPVVDPSGGRWYPRTQLNLFYWQRTPDGVLIRFSHQFGRELLTNASGYEVVEYNHGFRQFPRTTSMLLSAVYLRDHWLAANRYPPDMTKRFADALTTVDDEREAYFLRYCYEKSTSSGKVLWLGVLRNLAVLLLLVATAVSIVKASRASTAFRSLKLALKESRCMCGYSLAGLTSPTCPECGRSIASAPTQSSTTLDA